MIEETKKPDDLREIQMSELNVDDNWNNRHAITNASVVELMKSIEKDGLLSPVVVREFLDEEENFGKVYDLVAGFRRVKAKKMLNDTTIKSVVKFDLTKAKAAFHNVQENLIRRDLSLQEESQALVSLIQHNPNMTEERIAKEIGKSRGWVQPRLMLSRMPQTVQDLAHDGFLNTLAIRGLKSFEGDQVAFLAEIKRIKEKAQNRQAAGQAPIMLKVRTVKKDDGKNPAATPQKKTKKEVDAVIDYLSDYGFAGEMFLKSLAWASGNISDLEFCTELKQHGGQMDGEVTFEFDTSGFTDVTNETV